VDGWIAFVAQKGPNSPPEVAQVVQLDGDGMWWPDEERVASPTWSPSGRHLVWLGAIEIGHEVPPAYVLARPEAYDLSGQPVQVAGLAGLEYNRFLPPGAMTDEADWLLAEDADGTTVAVPLPNGAPQRWDSVKLGDREEDWLWSDDGRSATLRLLREPADHQVIELRASPGATPTVITLPGEPDRRLLDWPVPDRLLAGQAIHVLANSNWRNPPAITIDPATGVETPLGIWFSDYGTYVAPGRFFDRHPVQPGPLAIVAASPGDDWRNPWQPDRIALVDVTTGTWRHVTPEAMLAVAPRWSPDGRRLAFAAIDPAPEQPDDLGMLGNDEVHRLRRGLAIHVLDVDSGAIRRLTEPGAAWDSRPEWSGDGTKIVVQRGFDPAESSGRTRFQVRVVPADGGPDALLLDHVGPDWAYRPGTTPPGTGQ
jgi:dipeptidyl aminopeptidase/acylaminoacyl peptidase